MAENLATWVVELQVAGAAELDRALDGAKKKAEEQAKAIEQGNLILAGGQKVSIGRLRELETTLKSTKDKTKEFAGAIAFSEQVFAKQADAIFKGQLAMAGGYALLTSRLMGYVNAGIAASAEGQRLAWVQGELNRQIASLFAPQIRAVIEGLTRLTEKLKSLSGDQQAQIRNTILGTTAFLGMYALAPLVASGIGKIGAAMTALSANPLLGALAIMSAFLVGTEEGRTALGDMAEAVQPLVEALAKLGTAIAPLAADFATALATVMPAIRTVVDALAKIIETVGPTAVMVGVWLLMGKAVNVAVIGVWNMVAALAAKTAATLTAAGAVGVLTAAWRALLVSLGPIGLAFAAIGILASLFGLIGGKKEERTGRGRDELGPRVGGMESFEATFRRSLETSAQLNPAQATRERMARGIEELRDDARRDRATRGSWRPAIGA